MCTVYLEKKKENCEVDCIILTALPTLTSNSFVLNTFCTFTGRFSIQFKWVLHNYCKLYFSRL